MLILVMIQTQQKYPDTIHDSNNINNTMMTPEEAEILNTKEDALIKNNEISVYKTILKIDKRCNW